MATTKKQRVRRQYGSGSLSRRCDPNRGCPDLVDGPPGKNGKPTRVRPTHTCQGLYVGYVEAGSNRKGDRRRIAVYGATESETKDKLERKRRQLVREGTPEQGVSERTTVKAWSEEWLEHVVLKLRPAGSYDSTAGAVKNWVVPTIGRKRLNALTPADVRAVAAAQRAAGRSTSTALRTHSVLMGMLKDATVEGHQVPPRVFLTAAPTKAVSDRMPFEVDEAVAVLGVASGLPHGSRWATAFLQGMRQAECLGLTWSAIDFDRGLLAVEWQLKALRYRDRKNKAAGFRVPDGYEARHLVDAFHLVRPKSRAGYRVIPLVPWIRDALLQWREIAPANEFDLVWPTAAGRPANVKHDRAEWDALQCTAGVGHPAGRWYVEHEARHTTATLLMEAGVDPAVIIAIMGHSSIVTSRIYMHASTSQASLALEQVAARLQLVSAEPRALEA